MVRDRIEGIDRVEVVRAWKAVERRLDRGPRQPIIDLLEEREELAELQDHVDLREPYEGQEDAWGQREEVWRALG